MLFPIFCLYPSRYLLRCGCYAPSGDARLPAVLSNPLIYSLTLSLTQSYTQSSFRPPANALTRLSSHPPTHSLVIPRTHHTNALNPHSTLPTTHSPVIAPTHLTHTHPVTPPIHCIINQSMHSPAHHLMDVNATFTVCQECPAGSFLHRRHKSTKPPTDRRTHLPTN
jgi:hypothetical protein